MHWSIAYRSCLTTNVIDASQQSRASAASQWRPSSGRRLIEVLWMLPGADKPPPAACSMRPTCPCPTSLTCATSLTSCVGAALDDRPRHDGPGLLEGGGPRAA
jgi:hypothetical protein